MGGAKLMYPGDPSGPAREIYNCRCRRQDIVGGFDKVEPVYRRDQLNGQLISDMSYEEWEQARKGVATGEKADIIKAQGPMENFDRKARTYTAEEDLAATNPNYSALSHEWSTNCQRCVPTYEMRRRGYKVTAKPQPCADTRDDALAMNPTLAWDMNGTMPKGFKSRRDIETAMAGWGDGARAQIKVAWTRGNEGHTFMAEQRNGITVFFDPQTGSEDCSEYFSEIAPDNGFGNRGFWRIDSLQPSNLISECCENKGV